MGLFISQPQKTLAIATLPVQGFVAEVVLRLCELYVVELGSRIYDVISNCHRTNLIWPCSLSLNENVAIALLCFLIFEVASETMPTYFKNLRSCIIEMKIACKKIMAYGGV